MVQSDASCDGLDARLRELENSSAGWRDASLRERAHRVRRLRRVIARDADEIADVIATTSGRSAFEAMTQEVIGVLEMSRYCERKMRRWLRSRSVRYASPGFLRTVVHLDWDPVGTIAVLAPFNFPFSMGLMTTVYALMAGNCVALKPSDRTPEVADLIERLVRDAGLAPGPVAVIQGGIETGRALAADPRIDKVVLFGGTRAGQEVRATCQRRGVPFVLELGGGSSAIVLRDADLDRAANGLAWAAFYAGGQACVGAERVFVERAVAAEFLERLTRAAKLAWTDPGTAPPEIIADVPADSPLLQEELFAPVVAVCPVDDLDQAVDLANRGPMLAASVWSRDRRRARSVASRLDVSMVWVNDSSFGLPNLPWGGRGASGTGSLFSHHSLHEVARLRWTADSRAFAHRPWWFPYRGLKVAATRFVPWLYRL